MDSEFKKLIGQHKNVIKSFLEAREKLSYWWRRKIELNGIKIRLIARGNTATAAYSVQIGDKIFFIKEQARGKARYDSFRAYFDLAAPQGEALERAEKLVLKNKKQFPNIEIAKPRLTWTNRGLSFLVTDFYDGKTLDKINPKIIPDDIYTQFLEVTKLLTSYGFHDFHPSNIIWLPKDNKIVFIDLRY
ncbi:MAG TPA: hypothetical protein VFF13_04470 [archaeon]|nr:hypothetical protein [archaeon]